MPPYLHIRTLSSLAAFRYFMRRRRRTRIRRIQMSLTGIRAFPVPFLLPIPIWRPFRRASAVNRARAREWMATGFLMIKPSLIKRRTWCLKNVLKGFLITNLVIKIHAILKLKYHAKDTVAAIIYRETNPVNRKVHYSNNLSFCSFTSSKIWTRKIIWIMNSSIDRINFSINYCGDSIYSMEF